MALQNQPTAAPNRKVSFAGVWGALAFVVMLVLKGVGWWPTDESDALGLWEALQILIPPLAAFVGGYLHRERNAA